MNKTKRNLIIIAVFLIPMLVSGIVVMPLVITIYFLVFFISVNPPVVPVVTLILSGPALLALLPYKIMKWRGIQPFWPRWALFLLSIFLNTFGFFLLMYLWNELVTGKWSWPLPY